MQWQRLRPGRRVLDRQRPEPPAGLAGGVVPWLVAGAFVRLVVAATLLGRPNSDEAVAMLMARHAAHGELRALYWGNTYGGALSALLEAPFVRLFGAHIAVFRFVNAGLSLASALLIGWIAARLLGPHVATPATAVFWLFPPLWIVWSIRDYEFYQPGLLVALAAVAVCLRTTDRDGARWLWAVGLTAGLSLWAFPLLGCIVLPAVGARLWTLRARPAAVGKALLLAPLGAAPWIFVSIRTHLATLHSAIPAGAAPLPRLGRAVTTVLPATFLYPYEDRVPGPVRALLGISLFAGVAVLAWRCVRSRRYGLAMAAAPLLVWPFILAAASVYEVRGAGRYGLLVLPTTALLAGWGIARLRREVAAGVLACGVVVTVLALWHLTSGFRPVPHTEPRITALGHYLVQSGRTHVYASYWTAYVLALATGEKVTADPVAQSRYPPYRAAAERAAQSTYVVAAGQTNDQAMSGWLAAHGGGVRVVVGPYAVYDFDGRVSLGQLPSFVMELM